ncbi:MAG: aspartyl/asparaginyl beta-hydroxylase domain-containing protein [Planctomycetota bacterium]
MGTIISWVTSPVFLLVLGYVACVGYVHLRGKVRLRVERQLTEHSGLFAPLNALLYLFSAVPKDPLLSARDFPELAVLRDNWETIRDEALAVYDAGKIDYHAGQQDLAFVSFKKLGWKRFHMKWYGDFLPSALERAPRTTALLASIPNINSAAFTLLPPGGKLGKHRDPFASSLRYHLGLVCPAQPGCRIWVDGDEYSWKDGEDVVFDETYVHWAENTTDQPRLILFADITRPLRTRVMRGFNQFLIDRVYGITASHNEANEKPGALNRVTPVFFHLKSFFRGIKTRVNRRLYYAGKYALLGLCVWAAIELA